MIFIFFFFFQAEDGIRDYKVTGVQTCALPIYIVEDARFSTNVNRAKNRLELGPMLKELIRSFPRDLLLERLTAAGIPCGRVAGLHEALTSERTRRGGLLRDMPHPVVGTTPVFAPPYRLDGQRLPIRHAPPTRSEE